MARRILPILPSRLLTAYHKFQLLYRIFYFFFLMIRPPPRSTLFPNTTLFRSNTAVINDARIPMISVMAKPCTGPVPTSHRMNAVRRELTFESMMALMACLKPSSPAVRSEEHTSDSSHSQISYAVLCLKKKKLEGKRIHESVISIVPKRSMEHAFLFEDALNRVVGRYIRGQLTLALIIVILASIVCVVTD